jgi:hypothetical protein
MIPTLVFFAAVVVLSFLGTTRRLGFWGTFFASILLTPVGGLLLLLVAGPSESQRRSAAQRRLARRT